ncbi:MAG: FkbM family methyltransferase [Bacteroidales bacterium]|jgi:FkbM family methyltransferase
MLLTKLLKKIPWFRKKLAILNPKLKDILYTFFKEDTPLTLFDVGANTGQTIDFALRTFPKAKIYSFEPTPQLVSDLKKKYQSNSNIFISDLALSDHAGFIDFHVSEFSPTNSCLEPDNELYENFDYKLAGILKRSNTIKVETIDLDTWYKQNMKEESIDFMKIDTQGFEFNVIKGGINILVEHTKVLCFEIQYLSFYKNQVPFYKIYEFLYDNGFIYYCQLSATRNNFFQILESDVVFINTRFIKPL